MGIQDARVPLRSIRVSLYKGRGITLPQLLKRGKMTIHIVTHGGCLDGFGAALAAWMEYGDKAQYHFCNYGDPPPASIKEGDTVYITDFSFKYPVLVDLQAKTKNLVMVLDHHKTAQADLLNYKDSIFDMDRSGAVIAWQYFHPDKEVPLLLRYIQDRDLWKHELPYTKQMHCFCEGLPFDFERWYEELMWIESLVRGGIKKRQLLEEDPCVIKGASILEYKEKLIEDLMTKVDWTDIGGYWVPVVNCSRNFGSDVCSRLCHKYPEAKFSAYYSTSINPDGSMTRYWGARSIYFDVSRIAKGFGGGGHKLAAGWTDIIRGG